MTENTTTKPDIIDAIDEAILDPEAPAAEVVPNKPAPAKGAAARALGEKPAARKPAAKKAPAKPAAKAPTKAVAKVPAATEVIEAEIIEQPKAMSTKAAEALDKKIKTAAANAKTALTTFYTLMDEAREGHIYLGLGLRSWTEYVGTLQLPPMEAIDTDEVIEKLHESGAGQRTIAKVTGKAVSTVNKKVKAADAKAEKAGTPKAPVTSTGVDGKEYTRKTPARAAGAAKSSATKTAKSDTGRATGKPQTERTIMLGNVADDLEHTHYAKFLPGEIRNIRRIAKAAEKILREHDLNATNNQNAKA